MHTYEKIIAKLYEYTENEKTFKKYSSSKSMRDVFCDFDKDFQQFFVEDIQTKFIKETDKWYSDFVDYTYPRHFPRPIDYLGIIKHDRFVLPFLHNHNYFEIIYVLEGDCTQTIGGKKINMKKGDLCILSPGTVHSIYTFNEKSIVLNFIVGENAMRESVYMLNNKNTCVYTYLSAVLKDNSAYGYLLCNTWCGMLENVMLDICRANFEAYTHSEFYFKSKLCEMLFCLMEFSEKSCILENCSIKKEKNALEIIEYIRLNYKNVDMNSIAEKFHYNSQYLSRLIKKETGKNFTYFLTKFKILEACRLLAETGLSVEKVGLEVGYNSTEHFIRSFSKEMGVTPNLFRKSQKISIKW